MRQKISKYRAQIMGASIVFIFFMHIFHTDDENSILGIIQRFAFIGVDFFVALSMFGLYHLFEKAPIKSLSSYFHYLWMRILRIYVVFLPITIIIMLVDNWSIATFIKRLFFIEQLSVSLSKHLWFIPMIVLFYIFAPLCYMLVKKVKNVPVLTVVVSILIYVLLFLFHATIRNDVIGLLMRIPDIFIGFMLASYDETLGKKNKLIYSSTILIMFLLGAAIMIYEVIYDYFYIFYGDNVIHNNLTTPGFIIIFAVLFDFFGAHKLTKSINDACAFLGAITLEIYCTHEWLWKYISNLQIKESKKYLACIIIVLVFSLGLNKIGNMLKAKFIPSQISRD